MLEVAGVRLRDHQLNKSDGSWPDARKFLSSLGAGKIVDEGIECGKGQDLCSVNDCPVAFFSTGVFGESRGVDGYAMRSDLNHRMNGGGQIADVSHVGGADNDGIAVWPLW